MNKVESLVNKVNFIYLIYVLDKMNPPSKVTYLPAFVTRVALLTREDFDNHSLAHLISARERKSGNEKRGFQVQKETLPYIPQFPPFLPSFLLPFFAPICPGNVWRFWGGEVETGKGS